MEPNLMYQVKLEALKYARSTFVSGVENVTDSDLLAVADNLYKWIVAENKIVTV